MNRPPPYLQHMGVDVCLQAASNWPSFTCQMFELWAWGDSDNANIPFVPKRLHGSVLFLDS